MTGSSRRSVGSVVAKVLYIIAVLIALGVTLELVLTIFIEPGDTLGFMFGLMETRFLPSTLTALIGMWSLAYLKWPPIWLQLLCVPMAGWGAYALMQFTTL